VWLSAGCVGLKGSPKTPLTTGAVQGASHAGHVFGPHVVPVRGGSRGGYDLPQSAGRWKAGGVGDGGGLQGDSAPRVTTRTFYRPCVPSFLLAGTSRALSGHYPDNIRTLSGDYPDTLRTLSGHYADRIRTLSGSTAGIPPAPRPPLGRLTTTLVCVPDRYRGDRTTPGERPPSKVQAKSWGDLGPHRVEGDGREALQRRDSDCGGLRGSFVGGHPRGGRGQASLKQAKPDEG
jgi:hypothetical protein